MKLWIGGEISTEVADDFRRARASVERAVNDAIEKKSYLINLNAWDCIAVLRDDDAFKEITKYSPKKKEMDFRIKIDFRKFRSGNDLEREALIFGMLDRSLMLLKEKGIDGADIDRLASDVKAVGLQRGWVNNNRGQTTV